MSFKRSWSRRLAAILSAVMVVSTAAPISVPAMEAQADDILSPAVTEENNSSHVMDDEALVAEDGAALTAGEDTLLDAGDELAAELTDGALTDEPAEDLELIDETDALIEEPETASDVAYTGALKLNTVSAGLVRKIAYKFDDGEWKELGVTADGPKTPISFSGVKKITFKLTDAEHTTATIPLGDYYGYKVVFSVDGNADGKDIDRFDKEVSFTLKDCGFKQNGVFNVNMNAKIQDRYNKKGNLVIHVASENVVPGTDKIISINTVKVRLLDYYCLAYDDSGNIVKDKYSESASVNNIGVGGYGGTITLPYWCADYVFIQIDDTSETSGNDENGTRYAYTIGDKCFYSTKAKDTNTDFCNVDLAYGIGVDTHITIGVKQRTFDPEIKFSTVSNRILTGFAVTADDGYGHTSTYNINDLSDDVVKTQVFNKARQLSFDYNSFTYSSTASSEFDRGSGNGKNWAYRIEYKDTEGKEISKSLCKSGDTLDIKIDANDRFPEEIKVSAIPNVKVTLSANGIKSYGRDTNDILKEVEWEVENGNSDNGYAVDGKYSFWVEPGRTVSIKKLAGKQDYIFPYVEEVTLDFRGGDTRPIRFTLPEITEDRTFSVSYYEFNLEDKNLITVTNGVREDGQPGKATVSINGFSGFGAGSIDNDPRSQLYGKKVLAAILEGSSMEEKQLEIEFKMDSTESLEYSFKTIAYNCYDFTTGKYLINLQQGSDDTEESAYRTTFYNIYFKPSKDAQGNNIAKVYIPTRWLLLTLLKEGKLELTVTEKEKKRKSTVGLSESTLGTIRSAGIMVGGEYRSAGNDPRYLVNANLPYGSDVFLKAEPVEGFRLASVDIKYPSNADNNETITGTKELAAFTSDEGYQYKLRESVNVIFNTEPVYCAVIRYKTGSDELKPKNGKYSIDLKRPVLIQYKKGNDSPAAYTCDIFVGSVKTDSNEGISRSGDVYTVDASKGSLAGKNVTFKFYTGNGSKTDTSLQTLVLAIDKADTGVGFEAEKYTVPLGTVREINVNIKGSFEAEAELASDKAYDKTGLDISLDSSKKKLIFKSTAASKPDTYTINIVNSKEHSVVYGSVKVELETTTVKTAQAPRLRIVGTSNSGVTVGLKADKIDKKIDGLAFKVRVTTSGQKKGYFETTRTVYVPITETATTIEMMTNAAKKNQAAKVDGDTDAQFTVEAWIVQVRSVYIVKAAEGDQVAISTASAKADPVSPKEGKIFETKLRLKKISKGAIYNTMSAGNAYRLGVIYSKKTQVQMLDHVELLTGSGEEVDYPVGRSMEDYLSITDDHTIAFHPGGLESILIDPNQHELKYLTPGTYMIKAYALEPFGLEVSASIKVKVEKGINDFNTDGIARVIYKQPGKAVSLQLTALAKCEDYVKIKSGINYVVFTEFSTRKVRFEIEDEKKYKGMIKISKSGKITINKKFEPDDTELTVRIIADDFTRSPETDEVIARKTIAVRSSYDLDNLILAYSPATWNNIESEYEDEFVFYSDGLLPRLKNSHFIHELTATNCLNSNDTRWSYAPQFWITAYERNDRDDKSGYVPVNFKISGAGRLIETKSTQWTDNYGAHGTCARIEITDIDKDIKISAFAADGSGRKVKNYKVRINSANGKLGIYIADGQSNANYADKEKNQNALEWDWGNTDLTFDSYAMEKDGMSMLIGTEFYDNISFVKYRISSVKGGRIAKGRFYQNKIYPTAAKTTFTVTDMISKKDYKVTINNNGYAARNKKTVVTVSNRTYDDKKGSKEVNGVIYSHLDFSKTYKYMDYDDVLWNTVKFHVDSAENDQYVMVDVIPIIKKTDGVYKVVTKPLGSCLDNKMKAQSIEVKAERIYTDGILRSGAAYPIKLTGKDFTIEFYDRSTKKFDMLPGTYKLVITPVRREGNLKYRTLAGPATVTIKVVAPPKANVKPAATVEFGISEGTVKKGDYSYFLKSPVYKDQGICYKETRDLSIGGRMNGFGQNFKIKEADQSIGKIKYEGNETIGIKDKGRNEKLQGWLMIEYQKVDGTVVEEPVKIKIAAKVDIRKK